MPDLKKHPPIERNPDGSLIRMIQKQHWKAMRIIREHCCNCRDDLCLMLDCGEEVTCPQLLSRSVCCTYFRYVLLKGPEADGLELELYHGGRFRRCERCGRPYTARSNNAKYCANCKAVVQREQKAEHAKRRRESSRKVEL